MDMEKLLKDQAQFVIDAYKAFESMKAMYMEQMGMSYGDQEIGPSPAIPVPDEVESIDNPEEESLEAEGYQAITDQWKSYMDTYARGEFPTEAFPPSLCQVPEEIDPNDPAYASGKPMGIPYEVWVHRPGAGRLVPDLDWIEG